MRRLKQIYSSTVLLLDVAITAVLPRELAVAHRTHMHPSTPVILHMSPELQSAKHTAEISIGLASGPPTSYRNRAEGKVLRGGAQLTVSGEDMDGECAR